MGAIVDNISEILDTLLAALSSGLKQTVESYCDIHTADSKNTLVATDGSLLSVVKIDGVKALVGQEEYERIHDGHYRTYQLLLLSRDIPYKYILGTPVRK